jgi:hypothetical protein
MASDPDIRGRERGLARVEGIGRVLKMELAVLDHSLVLVILIVSASGFAVVEASGAARGCTR